MDPEFEGMTEGELKKLLDGAVDYDERAKIRSAIRALKKSSGASKRHMTGTSVYRRPGFQTPQTVQIPNSVTGNVLPSSVKDGEPVKPPDKNTPTIGYLNATTTVKSPRRTGGEKKTPSQSSYTTQGSSSKEQESWWTKSQSSSRSQTPSDTSEYNRTHNRTGSADHEVFSEEQLVKESIPDSLKESTPEPVKELSPEPSPEPTPEPPKEPTPEPPKEPTPEPTPEPSPEPPKEPTPEPSPEPTPEPPKEPTPEPPKNLTPSPEPPRDLTPSPELEDEEEEGEVEDDDKFSDDEDEELQALEENGSQSSRQQLAAQVAVNKTIPIEMLQEVEPGLEENKDFRTKLRKADDTKIDTTAAFPSQKKTAEQLDFRNVLRKTTGPEKKSFKVEQVDFRDNIKRKEEDDITGETSYEDPIKQQAEEDQLEQNEEEEEEDEEEDVSPNNDREEEKLDTPEEKSVKILVDEDSYEERKEARRKEKEEREREERERKTATTDSTNGALDEDSYEARREARRKAREAKRNEQQGSGGKGKELSYKEKQQLEQAKRMEENKKKFASADQQNGSQDSKPAISRQKSTGNRGAQQLLAWCQHKTKYYENVEVKDFSNSFANGLALCAILHTFVPDDVPYDDLSPSNPTENFGVALQVSEDLGIGSFFDVEDLVSVKAPDPKSMMTFLATIYQHFK